MMIVKEARELFLADREEHRRARAALRKKRRAETPCDDPEEVKQQRRRTRDSIRAQRQGSRHMGKSSAYGLGYALTKEAHGGGLMAILRRLGKQVAVGAGRKSQEIAGRGRPLEELMSQFKGKLKGQRYVSPAEKLHRFGMERGFGQTTARNLGAMFAEYPGATTVGTLGLGGLTLAQLNQMLHNIGQDSAIRGLQKGTMRDSSKTASDRSFAYCLAYQLVKQAADDEMGRSYGDKIKRYTGIGAGVGGGLGAAGGAGAGYTAARGLGPLVSRGGRIASGIGGAMGGGARGALGIGALAALLSVLFARGDKGT